MRKWPFSENNNDLSQRKLTSFNKVSQTTKLIFTFYHLPNKFGHFAQFEKQRIVTFY